MGERGWGGDGGRVAREGGEGTWGREGGCGREGGWGEREGGEGGWGVRGGEGRGVEGRGGEGGMTVIHIIIGMFNRPLSRKRHCNRE